MSGAVSAVPAAVASPDKSPEALARETGQKVELPDSGTERTKIFVNPDGTRTLESRAEPVRVRRDTGWVPIDTGLRERADGAVEPAATTTGLVFSGGGDDQLVKLSKDGKDIALTWPGTLPEPRLDGDSATYPEVYPGVDLVLHAKTDGFTQVLVVKNRDAAKNSALERIKLGARTTGLTLREDQASGNPEATDNAGKEVFAGATPMMWDSAGGSTTSGPGDKAGRKAMDTVVTDGSVEVVPDQKLLTSPDTVYPVYIDPPLNAGRYGGTELWKHAPEDENWNNWFQGVARAGYETQTGVTVRSAWSFDISALAGKQVLTAWFQATQRYAWNCTKSQIDLWRTSVIDGGTNWNNVWWRQKQSGTDEKGVNCSNQHNGFDFKALTGVSAAVADGDGTIGLGLWATNESNVDGWRKFDPNPQLNITYNTRPNPPAFLTVAGASCARLPGKPLYIREPNPEVAARVSDPDGAENPKLFARFEMGDLKVQVNDHPNGEIARARFGEKAFVDGQTYTWKAFAGDGGLESSASANCTFTYDSTPPNKPPLVSSADFPTGDQFHGHAGTHGSFTFNANGVEDVAGFRYGYDNPPVNSVAATNGSATVNITAKHLGRNVIYVQSVDRAGNVSVGQPVAYKFQTDQQSLPTGRWLLDGDGTDTADVPHDLTPSSSGVSWTPGRDGQAVQLDGTNGGLSTAQPVVRTDKSFSVAAWVKLDRKGDWFVAVSQDGARNSGFLLQYSHSLDRWVFNLPGENGGESAVASKAAPETGVWTRLIGVYDAASGDAKLYVSGVFQGAVKRTAAWSATGGLQVGRGKLDGNPWGRFPGGVDDVVVYDRTLVAEDISELSNRPAVMEAHWSFDNPAGPVTVPPPTLYGGATWTTGHAGGDHSALSFDGNGGHARSDRRLDTTRSFTVSTWVNLRAKGDESAPVLSQDGTAGISGMLLQWNKSWDRWMFSTYSPNGSQGFHIRSKDAPAVNTWTHLVGVYDDVAKQLRLYVNGALQGSVPVTTTWATPGTFNMGRGKPVGLTRYLSGAIEGTVIDAQAANDAGAKELYEGHPGDGALWRLEPAARSAADDTDRRHTAALIGGSSLSGGSLTLNGTDGYAATAGPVVRTDQSFSVVVRAKLSQTGGRFPVISQIGDRTSGFSVEYDESVKTWRLRMTDADKDGPNERFIKANRDAVKDEEVHLAAVYDAAAGELRLYVDGHPQGDAAFHVSEWHARGPVQIGQGRFNGQLMQYFNGTVNDARLYQGVLTPNEIRLLADA
ncbi:LamG domain-containing protein [Lentzea sp. NPDC051838]|uniref:LamG domain-containing protein n=1 Tax=Lentzea sp. NPDC051838 TaxID=3154849 RepID=UPI00342495B6